MNCLATVLAVWLAVVAADAALGFRWFRRMVWELSGAWCAAFPEHDRHECTARVFYGRGVWGAVSVLVGLATGYVAFQALKPVIAAPRRR